MLIDLIGGGLTLLGAAAIVAILCAVALILWQEVMEDF